MFMLVDVAYCYVRVDDESVDNCVVDYCVGTGCVDGCALRMC